MIKDNTQHNQEYKNVSLQQICCRLRLVKKALILFHERPDADALGSALALKLILKDLGANAYCVCSDPVPERLRFLVKDYQMDFSWESIPSALLQDADTIAISVDSASPSQLGSLYDNLQGKIELMIDHHGKGTRYADGLVIPEAAATGEILAQIAEKIYDLQNHPKKLSVSIATLLYAAISSDTGCFRYSNVTGNTLRQAALLCDIGVDIAEINRMLFEVKSKQLMLAEHVGYEKMSFYLDNQVSVIVMDQETQAQYGFISSDLETLVDVARMPSGVLLAVTIRETNPNTWRVSMRANADIDVSLICASFGGGGHKRAAGCTVEQVPHNLIVETIISRISKYCSL